MAIPKAKKHLGQNFLVDRHITSRIVDLIQPDNNHTIIEIGPGQGALTKLLLQRHQPIEVIEYDSSIIPYLMDYCQHSDDLVIHQQDVLTFDFNTIFQANPKKLIIAGNLPYNISTPILFHLNHYIPIIHHMVFMLQKEMAERISAPSGNKQYGRISVVLQYLFDIQPAFDVPPSAFKPQPKVTSQVIKLTPKITWAFPVNHFDHFCQTVKAAFSQRRKTLKNTLKNLASASIIESANINPSARAENLSVDQFAHLSNTIIKHKNQG